MKLQKTKYDKSLFIFRRDFRVSDNTALINALKDSNVVIPIFIFTPEQIVKNTYKSNNSVQFMIESLKDLEKQLKKNGGKLYYFYGSPSNVITKIIKNEKIDALFLNMDYTPYSIKRDKKIEKICKRNKISFNSFDDITLHKIGSIQTDSLTVYTKFTPYFNKAKKIPVGIPNYLSNNYNNYYTRKIEYPSFNKPYKDMYKFNDKLWQNGGREIGLKILHKINLQKKYNKTRNDLSRETTNLSAFLKYGCLSIREVYHYMIRKLGKKNDLIKQLHWRDFYYNIMYAYPYVIKSNLKPQYNKLKWNNNKIWLDKWKKGETGFPIVDAGMRQLNTTGYMHNRARLITCSFLIKLLHIDWRFGEKYFSQKLYDIDLSQNNGNFGWVSSTGADSQPYFRIFNPWAQSIKHDINCNYIKKWIPELADIDNIDIHNWYKTFHKYTDIKYPKPIINYEIERKKAIIMYKRIF